MEVKAIWISRHEMPAKFKNFENVENREILFSTDYDEIKRTLSDLLKDFIYVLGVFPAAVQEVISAEFHGIARFYSAVSVPETEPELKKVRPFKFVRWACVSG